MNPDRWRQIEEVCHAAQEREACERAPFLDEACADDTDLRREVDSLLAGLPDARSFLETPVATMAAGGPEPSDAPAPAHREAGDARTDDWPDRDRSVEGRTEGEPGRAVLAPGTRLGPYEIVTLVGTGGMGEVYKARDTRLGRTVAIKVLPPGFASDPERRRRFEQEARAASALNHPHIVTIHSIEETEGVPFFTMEYVEGRTLAQMIPSRGLPFEELLRIAIPLTDAVGAAHQRGILHRDLKPANVMVTADGRVKVLDFGLAKLKEAVGQADSGSKIAADATSEGQILDTVAYMSPEQAEGKGLDERSDVFSLGILLYEMATGQRPFKGDTSVSVISAILKHTPDSVTDLRPELPRDLVRILKHTLNKDPEHRYQSAKDLRNDLETLKEDLDSGEVADNAARSGWVRVAERRRLVWAGALLAAAALSGAGAWWGFRLLTPAQQTPPTTRLFDEFTVTRLTNEEISGGGAAVSPDGRYAAYVFVEHGREGLRIRQVETSATLQIVPPGDVRYNGLTFTPDGNRLYYITYPKGSAISTLYEVPLLGGTTRRLMEDVDSAVAFSPDAGRFAFVRGIPHTGSALVIANADGTEERTLAYRQGLNGFDQAPGAWSPDGRTIAAAAGDESWRVAIVAVNAVTGGVVPVGPKRWDEVQKIVWLRSGSALIVAASDYGVADTLQLWEVSFPAGAVRRITKDIAGYSCVSLTAAGRSLLALRSEWRGTLWVAPAVQPDRVARIASVPNTVVAHPVRWTADGRILYIANVSGNRDIWAVRPDGSDLRKLTTSPGVDYHASEAPDNRHIVFVSDRDGRVRIWRMDPDGGRQMPLTNGPFDAFPVVAADSRSVYYVHYEQPYTPMYAVPIEGGEPTLLSGPRSVKPAGIGAGVPSGFAPQSLSPDGRLIVGQYFDEQQGRSRIAVVPVDGSGVIRKLDVMMPSLRFRESLFAWAPAWAPDGRAVTFIKTTEGSTNLWRQPLDGGPATRLTNYATGDNIVSHAWSHDGKWLALVRGTAETNVVIMRDVGPDR